MRPHTAIPVSSSPTRSPRWPSPCLDDRSFRSAPLTRNRLKKGPWRLGHLQPVSQQEVAQFAALPPALQRKQFSREDQILLAGRINSVILDAADEAILKQISRGKASARYRERIRELSQIQRARDPDDFSDDDSDDDDDDDDMQFTQKELESFRWLDEQEDLDLSLYDYHAAVTETTVVPEHAQEKRSRRSLSISNMPFSKRSSSKKSATGRVSLPSSLSHTRSMQSMSPVNGHRRNKLSASSLEPAATHYQDPAARMKLRVYLASPQKFDEAIEFGFPSLRDQTVRRGSRPGPSPRATKEYGPTFYDEDDDQAPSLSDGDDGDGEPIDSPQTPSAFSHGLSHDSSLDRSSFRPKAVRDFLDPYVHASSTNREMTLHMTLTRPDLRAPDEVPSSRLINSVPLEQPPLVFPDSPAAFWDSLPDDESKMKKLWRKLRLRG